MPTMPPCSWLSNQLPHRSLIFKIASCYRACRVQKCAATGHLCFCLYVYINNEKPICTHFKIRLDIYIYIKAYVTEQPDDPSL